MHAFDRQTDRWTERP